MCCIGSLIDCETDIDWGRGLGGMGCVQDTFRPRVWSLWSLIQSLIIMLWLRLVWFISNYTFSPHNGSTHLKRIVWYIQSSWLNLLTLCLWLLHLHLMPWVQSRYVPRTPLWSCALCELYWFWCHDRNNNNRSRKWPSPYRRYNGLFERGKWKS